MTKQYLQQITILLKRLGVAYLLYFISRFIFFIANKNQFSETGVINFLADSFYGLRFDSFSIVISNSLFILLSLLPFNFFNKALFQKILLWLFSICNAVFLAANYIDVGYYAFIRKRSTDEIFEQLGGQSDMAKLLPRFAIDFWWILLLYILSVYLMIKLYKKIKTNHLQNYAGGNLKQWLIVSLLFLVSIGFSVLGARGGFQRVPIDVVNAGAVTKPEEVPLVLNTPFTLIKSLSNTRLTEQHFYSDEAVKKMYNPIHFYKDSVFKARNVVVLILESFSKEYTKLGKTQKSITPFLDSLMNKSLVFTNGFSNGTKSIEGIPAILSGLPSLMENPFINSMYANNMQTSFASLLKKKGYTSAFFHGGINGTMNFTDWAPSAGYNQYFGRNEYNNEKDFDGFWGIFDEPFLQFTIHKMNGFKQPFHSAIFTLSSHHPYNIPEKYKNKFPKTKLENAESVGYADYSLKLFFESAKKTNWFNNTLFILTADHASISEHPFFSNPVGNLTIPILFYLPDNSLTGQCSKSFSQVDILPSAMGLLGYNEPFFAFGESYASPLPSAAIAYLNSSYFMYEDSVASTFINYNINCIYNYRRDSILNVNHVNSDTAASNKRDRRFKAFIQTYNSTLIHNSGYIK